MKKILLLAIAAVFLTGCTRHTEYGNCIGLVNSRPDPSLVYEVSVWNVIMGVVFIETIIVPVVVLLNSTHCPTGKR